MSFSRAEELALRRQMLVINASIQRMRLARDVEAVEDALRPAAIVKRAWRQWRASPWGGLLRAWRMWRRVRVWFS